MVYRLDTFGGFRLSGPNGPVKIGGKKLRGLLAYLACEEAKRRSRSRIVSLLWGTYFEDQARQNFRASLQRIRQVFGRSAIISEDDTVGLAPSLVECDATLFENLTLTGRLSALHQAVELYRGDFLDGLDIPEPAWEDWLRQRRQKLRSLALESLLRIGNDALACGCPDDAIAAGMRVAELDEFREDAHRLIMLGLDDFDRRAEALRVYEMLQDRLNEELGTAPSDETTHLAAKLRGTSHEPNALRTRRPTVAVLPFIDLSDASEQSSFCDGVTEDVTSELARFRDLVVTASSSAFAFKANHPDLATVRETLKVGFVVQGSLTRYSGRIRFSVRLSDAETGSQIWSERYDREVEQIFSVQDDLVRTISATLVGWLERRGRERARHRPTSSLAAYECVIEGRRHFLRMLYNENRKARALFEQALALDPGYAAAHAWLSEAHLGDWAGGWTPDPKESLALGYQIASKAVELDDTDSRTHTALARASCWCREFDRARHHFDVALNLNPSDAWALASSARCHILEGDVEKGVDQIEATVRLNPLGRYGYHLGIAYFNLARYADASRELRSVKEPIDLVYAWLAASLALERRSEEAADAALAFQAAFDQRHRDCGIETKQSMRSFLTERYPFRRQVDLAHLFDGLEMAGIAL